VSIFADTRHKSVTIATSLERAFTIRIFCYEADLGLPFIFAVSLAKMNISRHSG